MAVGFHQKTLTELAAGKFETNHFRKLNLIAFRVHGHLEREGIASPQSMLPRNNGNGAT